MSARAVLPPTNGSSPDRVWTVLEIISWSGGHLERAGVERARLDAEHLLSHALGMNRLQLYLEHDRPLSPDELDRFRPLLRRRARREPLQYILGRQPFRNLVLEVDEAVLIPRPETEVLVDEVLGWAIEQGRTDLVALDIGTGSGAIALSLAQEGPFHKVVATDLMPAALAVARRNRSGAGLDEAVELRQGDCLGALGEAERYDLIVSNPPYVAEREAGEIEPEVLHWEPREALFGGVDGLDLIRRIVLGAGAHLQPGGLLALEVGADQPAAVVALIGEAGGYDEVRVRKDLTGRDRFVLARWARA